MSKRWVNKAAVELYRGAALGLDRVLCTSWIECCSELVSVYRRRALVEVVFGGVLMCREITAEVKLLAGK